MKITLTVESDAFEDQPLLRRILNVDDYFFALKELHTELKRRIGDEQRRETDLEDFLRYVVDVLYDNQINLDKDG